MNFMVSIVVVMGLLDVFEEAISRKNVFVDDEEGIDLYMHATDGH